jgi:hypothetical protein
MAFTKSDVTHKQVDGELVELSDDEKQVIVDQWNTEKTAEQREAEEVQAQSDKESGNQKLRDLGLTDAEIDALIGGA